MLDPITILTTISVGLKLVDQFRDVALRFLGKTPHPPSGVAEQAGNALQIRYQGQITQQVQATQLNLNEWDETRYRALERRIKTNWDIFYELFSEEPGLSVDERARIKVKLGRIKAELCADFREMVRIYERALGTSLPDHYSLYEVCGN